MKIFVLLFFTFVISAAHSASDQMDEGRKPDYPIDWKYKAGDYLIYDCDRGHYACVDKDGYTNCDEERKYALEVKAKIYPCAPLKKFTDKKECIQKQYEILAINANKRFCYPK